MTGGYLINDYRLFSGENETCISDGRQWPYRLSIIKQLKAAMIEHFLANSLFMRLSLLAPVILEDNVSPAFIREFKLGGAHIIDLLAQAIMPFSGATLQDNRVFINSFYQLSQMKWQHCHVPNSVATAFAGEDFWLIGTNLNTELNQAFDWLWQGLIHKIN